MAERFEARARGRCPKGRGRCRRGGRRPDAPSNRPGQAPASGRDRPPQRGQIHADQQDLGEDRLAHRPRGRDHPRRHFADAGLGRDADPHLRHRRDAQTRPGAGQGRKLSVADGLRAVRFAEVVVVLLDAAIPFEQQDLRIADLAEREGRAVVVAVNKWDVETEKQQKLRDLREAFERLLPQLRGAPLVTVSAKTGRGWTVCARRWKRRMTSGTPGFPPRKLNRWLTGMVAAHPPPAPGGRRIKLRYMTQAKTRPPGFVVMCSHPDKLPESYSRYLVNGLRDDFDMPGTPIRLHMRSQSTRTPTRNARNRHPSRLRKHIHGRKARDAGGAYAGVRPARKGLHGRNVSCAQNGRARGAKRQNHPVEPGQGWPTTTPTSAQIDRAAYSGVSAAQRSAPRPRSPAPADHHDRRRLLAHHTVAGQHQRQAPRRTPRSATRHKARSACAARSCPVSPALRSAQSAVTSITQIRTVAQKRRRLRDRDPCRARPRGCDQRPAHRVPARRGIALEQAEHCARQSARDRSAPRSRRRSPPVGPADRPAGSGTDRGGSLRTPIRGER